jgi:hypothetical protein
MKIIHLSSAQYPQQKKMTFPDRESAAITDTERLLFQFFLNKGAESGLFVSGVVFMDQTGIDAFVNNRNSSFKGFVRGFCVFRIEYCPDDGPEPGPSHTVAKVGLFTDSHGFFR